MTGEEGLPGKITALVKSTLHSLVPQRVEPLRQEIDPDQLIKNVLNETRFMEVPSYWSGLPANREYFTSVDLMRIYGLIDQRVGKQQAYAFANMILDMTSLAPANIVRASFSLSRNNYIYDSQFSGNILQGKTNFRPVSKDVTMVEDAVAEGIFGITAADMTEIPDESEIIKSDFRTLLKNDLKPILSSRNIIDPN